MGEGVLASFAVGSAWIPTLFFMNFVSLERDRGGLLVRDINSRFSTTLLNLLSVLLTRKL